MRVWRRLDTGLRGGAENLALHRAIAEARRAGESPSTLRFLRFTPSAIVGASGDPARELDLAYCRARAIEVQRRFTGGGAIYMDPGVLAWELYLDRGEAGAAEMAAIARRICEALARALSGFSLAACHRAPADVTIGGRKVSGSGGAWEDDLLTYQGTLLVDFDVACMLRALGTMNEAGLRAAREGLADLRGLLGEAPELAALRQAMTDAFASLFGVRMVDGGLSGAELHRAAGIGAQMESEAWVYRASLEAGEPAIHGGKV